MREKRHEGTEKGRTEIERDRQREGHRDREGQRQGTRETKTR